MENATQRMEVGEREGDTVGKFMYAKIVCPNYVANMNKH